MTGELKNKLEETLTICDLHHQRMMFAMESLEKYFPIKNHSLSRLNQIDLAFFDQLIYRFSKLQDSMGSRLFKQLLQVLEEDVSNLAFIDVLNKLEKLKLLDSAKDWIKLRQTRNAVSHEYPFLREVQMEELNLLPGEVKKLAAIWLKLKAYSLQILKG